VAGLPLVRRIVLAAARAGFADIRVHKALAGAEDLLAGTRAATLTADEPDTPRAARRIVIVPANIVPQPRWLRSLLEAELRPETLYVDPSLAAVIESADPARVLAGAPVARRATGAPASCSASSESRLRSATAPSSCRADSS